MVRESKIYFGLLLEVIIIRSHFDARASPSSFNEARWKMTPHPM